MISRETNSFLGQKSPALQQAVPLKLCLSPYTDMPPTSSLRYSEDKLPCLYLGLQLSVISESVVTTL